MATTSEIKLTAELDLNEEQICDIIAKALEVDREDVKLSKVVKEKGGKSSVDIFVNVKKEFTVKTKEKEYIPIVSPPTVWPCWDPYRPSITWTSSPTGKETWSTKLDVPYTPTITTAGTDVHTITGSNIFNSTNGKTVEDTGTGTVTLTAYNSTK